VLGVQKGEISSPDLRSYAAWGKSIQDDTQWGDARRQGNPVRSHQADHGERESCKKESTLVSDQEAAC